MAVASLFDTIVEGLVKAEDRINHHHIESFDTQQQVIPWAELRRYLEHKQFTIVNERP